MRSQLRVVTLSRSYSTLSVSTGLSTHLSLYDAPRTSTGRCDTRHMGAAHAIPYTSVYVHPARPLPPQTCCTNALLRVQSACSAHTQTSNSSSSYGRGRLGPAALLGPARSGESTAFLRSLFVFIASRRLFSASAFLWCSSAIARSSLVARACSSCTYVSTLLRTACSTAAAAPGAPPGGSTAFFLRSLFRSPMPPPTPRLRPATPPPTVSSRNSHLMATLRALVSRARWRLARALSGPGCGAGA